MKFGLAVAAVAVAAAASAQTAAPDLEEALETQQALLAEEIALLQALHIPEAMAPDVATTTADGDLVVDYDAEVPVEEAGEAEEAEEVEEADGVEEPVEEEAEEVDEADEAEVEAAEEVDEAEVEVEEVEEEAEEVEVTEEADEVEVTEEAEEAEEAEVTKEAEARAAVQDPSDPSYHAHKKEMKMRAKALRHQPPELRAAKASKAQHLHTMSMEHAMSMSHPMEEHSHSHSHTHTHTHTHAHPAEDMGHSVLFKSAKSKSKSKSKSSKTYKSKSKAKSGAMMEVEEGDTHAPEAGSSPGGSSGGDGEASEDQDGGADPGTTADDDGPTQNIVEIASSNEDFSLLVTAVAAAGFVDVLSGDGPFTVFAPNDDAFDALPAGVLESLLAAPEDLGELLGYHVVSGELRAADLATGPVATLSDYEIDVVVGDDGAVTVNNATVIAADIAASNGVIHVIDAVLIPPDDPDDEDSEDPGDPFAATTVGPSTTSFWTTTAAAAEARSDLSHLPPVEAAAVSEVASALAADPVPLVRSPDVKPGGSGEPRDDKFIEEVKQAIITGEVSGSGRHHGEKEDVEGLAFQEGSATTTEVAVTADANGATSRSGAMAGGGCLLASSLVGYFLAAW